MFLINVQKKISWGRFLDTSLVLDKFTVLYSLALALCLLL